MWLVLDHFFDWGEMGADIVKRPYITVGMAALVLLIPLAATSTTGTIKRLGGQRVAAAAQAGLRDRRSWPCCTISGWPRRSIPEPYYYLAVLILLLGIRVGDWARRRLASRAPTRATSRV